jgi:biotin synthase
MTTATLRHNWTLPEIMALFALPFNDLLFEAQTIHRQHFKSNAVQISTLLSIKTGSCPEDCKYCPQSAHHDTGLSKQALMDIEAVVKEAQKAKEAGSSRFCMGAAWRSLQDRDLPAVTAMIREVKALGMETCVTLGMLNAHQATALKDAGLDYYNHNIDSSERFYKEIITTRTYQDRLDTLEHVRNAGLNVCCGGIIGMGETQEDRAGMLMTLANLPEHPESVPINLLVQVEGTPLMQVEKPDIFDFIRTIAVARILMPHSYVRLSAGREDMHEEAQALCFLAGANSIFYGERLLTTPNPAMNNDKRLFSRLGIEALEVAGAVA